MREPAGMGDGHPRGEVKRHAVESQTGGIPTSQVGAEQPGYDVSTVQANRHAGHRTTICDGFMVWYVVGHRN